MTSHYVYLHYELDWTPLYVGKGSKNRMMTGGRNAGWIKRAPTGFRYTKLQDGLTSSQAYELEDFILLEAEELGDRYNLSNEKSGHSGLCGPQNPMYGVHRWGKDNPMFGKKHSQKTKDLISKNASKGRKGMNRAQRVMDIKTGIIYECIQDMCRALNTTKSHKRVYRFIKRLNNED